MTYPLAVHGQPYPQQPVLPGYASYYEADINGFADFVNGVWSQVYQWDPSQESTDPGGNIIGGWKQLYHHNLVFDHYTEYGGYWEGFTVSNRDYEYGVSDPLNQFSAVTLGGRDGPGTPFLVGYYGQHPTRPNSCRVWLNDGAPCEIAGMYVTNSAYAYQSMLKGDGFAHPFGQGDWFLLTAYGYDKDGRPTTQQEFYLADFRSSNAADHYMVKDWRWFNLLSLGAVSSIEFVLTSSDNSVYGMNTPAYFCMDKLTLSLLSIKQQPSLLTVCAGEKAVLKTKAVGYDYFNPVLQDLAPRYQWRKNGVNIPGANDTVLTIPVMQESDAGEYSCVVASNYHTKLYGAFYNDPTYTTTVLSANAQISIASAIQITQQPLPQEIYRGEAASFSVVTTTGALSYQWYRNGLALGNGHGAILTIPNTSHNDVGIYHCVIGSHCQDLVSRKVSLTLKDKEPCTGIHITSSPASKTLLGKSDYTLNVETSGAVSNWRWYKNGQMLSGATNGIYKISNAQLSDTGIYRCVVSNACGKDTSVSFSIKVVMPWKVYPNPVAPGQQVTLNGYNGFVFRLYNGAGQVLHTFRVNSDAWRITLPHGAGVYTLYGEKQVVDADGKPRLIFNYEKVFVQ
jgi:hypothetical protein